MHTVAVQKAATGWPVAEAGGLVPRLQPAVGRSIWPKWTRAIDPLSGKLVITYQTFIVRTPKHVVLVDTCTGENKGYPPPMDFPKQPWLDGFRANGLTLENVDYVFCTHLHIDHTGWTRSSAMAAGFLRFPTRGTYSQAEYDSGAR